MRCFIAIELEPAVKRVLTSLHTDIPGCKWVRDEQLHLTLRFIGDLAPASVDRLAEALARLHLHSFDLKLRGIGRFPYRGRPRILWVGVRPEPAFEELWEAVNAAVDDAGGFKDEHDFSPHVTIGRFRQGSRAGPEVERLLEAGKAMPVVAQKVTEFILFRSTLRPQGALHEVLRRFPLG